MKKLTYENIAHAKELNVYLEQGNRVLDALGYTDHSQKHTAKVAVTAGKILKKLGYDAHMVELVRIAGYMHDLGNSINRVDHAHTGLSWRSISCATGVHRRKILPPSSRPSASTMNGAASLLTPVCRPDSGRQERRPPGPRPQYRAGNLRQARPRQLCRPVVEAPRRHAQESHYLEHRAR